MGTGSRVIWVGTNPLSVVDHSGKDEDTEGQEDDEKEEFIGTGSKGVAEDTETHKVTSELEDSEDTDESDNTEEPQDILGSFGGQTTQADLQVEGQDGNKVDDVEGTFEEFQLVWTEDDPQQDLNGKPNDAYAFNIRQPAVSHHFDHYLLTGHVAFCDVFCPVYNGVEGLVRLHAESGNGDEDEEEGNKCHILEERGVEGRWERRKDWKRQQGKKQGKERVSHIIIKFRKTRTRETS